MDNRNIPNFVFEADAVRRRTVSGWIGALRHSATQLKRYISMKNLSIIICLLLLPLLGAANTHGKVELLGEKANIPFDEVKAIYIANTVEALLQSCTVATKVESIPVVSYRGVRLTQPDGKIIEAHIFPDSKSSYMVKVFTRENGVIKLHGKYTDHAYQLISMLELKI